MECCIDGTPVSTIDGEVLERGSLLLPVNSGAMRMPFADAFSGGGMWAIWLTSENGTVDLVNLERRLIVPVRAVHLTDERFVIAGRLWSFGINELGNIASKSEWLHLRDSRNLRVSDGEIMRRTGVPMNSHSDSRWPYDTDLIVREFRSGVRYLVRADTPEVLSTDYLLMREGQTAYFERVR